LLGGALKQKIAGHEYENIDHHYRQMNKKLACNTMTSPPENFAFE
jgi:hypothetical protein